MNNAVFWDVAPCGSCKTDVSGEYAASILGYKINESEEVLDGC
jgi:hypothetical protein